MGPRISAKSQQNIPRPTHYSVGIFSVDSVASCSSPEIDCRLPITSSVIAAHNTRTLLRLSHLLPFVQCAHANFLGRVRGFFFGCCLLMDCRPGGVVLPLGERRPLTPWSHTIQSAAEVPAGQLNERARRTIQNGVLH